MIILAYLVVGATLFAVVNLGHHDPFILSSTPTPSPIPTQVEALVRSFYTEYPNSQRPRYEAAVSACEIRYCANTRPSAITYDAPVMTPGSGSVTIYETTTNSAAVTAVRPNFGHHLQSLIFKLRHRESRSPHIKRKPAVSKGVRQASRTSMVTASISSARKMPPRSTLARSRVLRVVSRRRRIAYFANSHSCRARTV